MDLCGMWEFWPDPSEVGEGIGVFLPGGGTGVEPYWAKDWPGYEQRPALSVDWQPIAVPGHWQAQGHAGYSGTAWYRLRFAKPAEEKGRPFLEFDGVDFYADVWLNGDYLGFHEGDFEPFAFDLTGRLQSENLLVVKVSAPVDARSEHKAMPKGGTYHWDALPVRQGPAAGCPEVPSAANPQYPNPVENPAGIWQPVRIVYRPTVYVAGLRVTPYLSDDYRKAEVVVEVAMENYGEAPAAEPLRLVLTGSNFPWRGIRHPVLVTLPPGRSTHTFTLTVQQPNLWWSWDLGFPHLHRLTATVTGSSRETVVGFRRFEKGENWELYLNGQRFFARGTNYLSDRFLSQMTPERYEQDIALMRQANMNMVRVFAHLELPHFYRRCDEEGIMLWQDLPFQWGYESSGLFIQRAVTVAKAAVRQVADHASVVLWCVHSESRLHDFNKLDEALLQAVAAVDRTRPVVKSSVLVDRGAAPRRWESLVEQAEYTREHVSVHWAGWYWGSLTDVEAYAPLFLTEFGTQSLPGVESLRQMLPEVQLWPPDWEAWRLRGFQKNIYEQNLGAVPESLAELVERTQAYQCRFYRVTIEALRRKKYRPVNGLLQFLFCDNWPAITWSIIDWRRVPKPAYQTVADCLNPVLLTFTYHPETEEVAVWVVNDYPRSLPLCRVLLRWEDGSAQTVEIGSVRPDEAAEYARVPSRGRRLEAELLDVTGAVLSRWSGELEPYVVPAGIEKPAIV